MLIPLIKLSSRNKPITLQLSRNLIRSLKRGNPWIFSDVIKKLPKALPGTAATLLDHKGVPIAQGIYDSSITLCFRVCSLNPKENLEQWAVKRFQQAIELRKKIPLENTNAYRLINGEGDGLPGLVCDIYDQTAVIKLDGEGIENFWNIEGISAFLQNTLSIKNVVQRSRVKGSPSGKLILGNLDKGKAFFLENNVQFRADLLRGQKTGFFFDQRENRKFVGDISKGKSVLNVFGYTGGFSVYAGLGGAKKVCTVDLSEPAIEEANFNWGLNNLDHKNHQGEAVDAFEFLSKAKQNKQVWDIVILDPPSFVPSRKSKEAGIQAYQKLITAGCLLTKPGEILIASSCSSHISQEEFLTVCQEAISKANRRAFIVKIKEQPADHPYPLNLLEFRYLKFVCMRIE